jgi:hypothetical protein
MKGYENTSKRGWKMLPKAWEAFYFYNFFNNQGCLFSMLQLSSARNS